MPLSLQRAALLPPRQKVIINKLGESIMKNRIKFLFTQTKLLFKEVPALTTVCFVLSVVLMNLLANVSLVSNDWVAVDAGIILSWVTFIVMDVLCRRFGATAANILSIFALTVNISVVLLFNIVRWIALATPDLNGWLAVGTGSSFLDVVAGDWRVVVSSSIALLVAAFSQNALNIIIKKALKPQRPLKAFLVASYISTTIGQFIDNLVFGIFAHLVFTIWGFYLNALQLIMFALVQAVIELVCEVIFSPLGYRIVKRWEEQGIGNAYLAFTNSKK